MTCKSLRSGIDDVWNYMLAVNIHMCKMKNETSDQDVQEVFFFLLSSSFRLFFFCQIVPFHFLVEEPFCSYIKETNNELVY